MSDRDLESPSMWGMVSSLWVYRNLIIRMTWREIIGRYKGSMFGLVWSFFNPLLMICVYTFVFSVVFKAKWDSETEGGQGEFAVILFAGMVVFNIFSECFNRAPTLIISHANYVKKIVFPLEILPWVVLGNAVFHAMVSLVVLLLAEYYIFGAIQLTALLFPIVLLPFMLMMVGLSWFVAASGVYLRDLSQIAGVLTTVLMFTSPLFFPLSALPEQIQPLLELNPLAYFIEMSRDVLIWGRLPEWRSLGVVTIIGISFAGLGYAWFQKTRKGFADVL